MKLLLIAAYSTALAFITTSARAGTEAIPVKIWLSEKSGVPEFTILISSCSGSPLTYNPKNPFLTELTMIRNSGGFVTVQGKITNPAPWRKTFRIGWEWRGPHSMNSTAPSDAALSMISLEGHEHRFIQGTSSIPNPTSALLTFFQHAK